MFQTLRFSAGQQTPVVRRSRSRQGPRALPTQTGSYATANTTASSKQHAAPMSTAKYAGRMTRACDRCRLHRIRCGARPCEQCRASNSKCVTSRDNAPQRRNYHVRPDRGISATPLTPESVTSPDVGSDQARSEDLPSCDNVKSEQGSLDAPDPGIPEYYQIDRPTLFFSKINSFFASAIAPCGQSARPVATHQDNVDVGRFPSILCPPTIHDQSSQSLSLQIPAAEWAYLIRLFWRAYHPMIPTLDSNLLDALYVRATTRSEFPNTSPVIDPLLDIVTALGMQHAQNTGLMARTLGSRLRDRNDQGQADGSTGLGYAFFKRCRQRVMSDIESCVSTIHCQALMAVYLMHGNHLQSASSTLGAAIRDAFHEDLHREPSSHLLAAEKDFRRNLWWLLFTLDVQCSYRLDEPSAIQTSAISVSTPAEAMSGSDQKAWYWEHLVRLAIAVSDIQRTVPSSNSFGRRNEDTDVSALEKHAETVTIAIDSLKIWRESLPPLCFSQQRGEGANALNPTWPSSMPTLRSLELDIPAWLQRQRILLQLHFHDVHNLLRRKFICFPRALNITGLEQPHTDQHARCALIHAKAIADVLHSHLSQSDLLSGWSEALQPLWNATVTMLAFIVANPLCTRSPGARLSIDKSLEIFRASASTCSLASHASQLIEVLRVRLDEVVHAVEKGSRAEPKTAATTVPSPLAPQTRSSGIVPPVADHSEGASAQEPSLSMEGLSWENETGWTDAMMFDENLRSWTTSIDGSTWQTYQDGLDDFLTYPDDLLTDAIQST